MFDLTQRYFTKSITDADMTRLSSQSMTFLERQEKCLTSLPEPTVPQADPRDMLRIHLANLGLKVNNRVFFQLGKEDNFEIWSLDFKFLGTGNSLIRRLSYSISDLLEMDWQELFERDPSGADAIMKAIEKLKTGSDFVEDVAPHHRVSEKHGRGVSAFVQVKCLALATDAATGGPSAIVAITNIQDQAAV